MEKNAKVIIIGGGVVGCSILYHLSKFGLKDCILLERNELTSGSSWHAAGNVHVISSDPNISRMMAYTIGLYKEIEKESGHSTGFKAISVSMTVDARELRSADPEEATLMEIGLKTNG